MMPFLRHVRQAGVMALVVAGLAISACSATPAVTNPQPDFSAGDRLADYRQTPSEARIQACKNEGGDMRREGRSGAWRCVTLYSDGGKVCRDKSECQGQCAAVRHDAPQTPGKETGVCAADDSRFGCRAEVINGTSTSWLCID